MHRSKVSLLLLLGVLASACQPAPAYLELSGPTMGTTYTVKVAAPPAGVDGHQIRAVIDEVLARIDREMSGYRADSEISRFNAAGSTDWIEVSSDVAAVVQAALEVSEQSGGAFDITVAPLVNAWGFGPKELPASPLDDEAIAQIREHIGYQKLHVRADPAALRKDVATLALDLNGIAPGFAVDLIAQRFKALRIESFMIDIGGEVLARGRNARGEAWRVAVERPIDTQPTPYAIVQLRDMSVTTSGEYRHYYLRDGKRYSHTIDPRTGRPVEHDLASVAVIGPTSMHIDAWATAFNVLGAQAGHELALQRGMPVMFIEGPADRLRALMTPQFKPFVAVMPAQNE